MRCKLAARLLAALFIQASAASAEGLVLLDPITTHVNGMPLATTDPHRDADVYAGCDRYHHGCCGGHYNCPLSQSIWNPKRCWATCIEKRPQLDDTTPGIAGRSFSPVAMFDGLEDVQVERLGEAPNVAPVVTAPGTDSQERASPLQGLLSR